MTIVFIKYRLLNGHRVEGMESFLACLGANMFWKVTIPYVIRLVPCCYPVTCTWKSCWKENADLILKW